MFRSILVLTIFVVCDAQQLVSPCPNLFSYDPEGVVGDRWFGTITVTAEAELSGLWMRTIFDRPFQELGTDFGEAVQREPTEYLIKKPKHKIAAGETLQIRIFARFNPTETPPRVLGFRLNARTVCPENGVIETTTQGLAEQLVSPCPELFSYETVAGESDRWYGTIMLQTKRELSGVWLRLVLDRPSMQLGNWFGEATTEDNKEYLIKNRNHKVKPGEITPLRFFVKFNPSEPVPKLIMYKLNAETVCPADSGGISFQPQTTISSTESTATDSWISLPPPAPGSNPDSSIFGSDFNPNSRPIFLPSRETSGALPVRSGRSCGIVAAQPRPLITHGEATKGGQWPWHAALYYSKGIDLQYICGASLISMTHVLSAAHCVAKRTTDSPVGNDDIIVILGKYHLRNFSSKGIQNMQVQNIIIHPEYNHRYYANDIAVIRLANPAEYTDYVRPVCIWSDNTDISSVVDKEGTVVGWGYDQTGKVTEHLTKANMPVVSHSKCIWSYPEFFSKFANAKTFCAGFRNGTSVCNGDSGGGLVFPKVISNPNQPVWQIRGVVSISVALQSEFICDTSQYAIFTDVAKYLDWIRQNVIS